MGSPETDRWKMIGRSPIHPDAPAGGAVRDDPVFERLDREAKKLESLVGNEKVNWNDVISLSTLILKEKSKDLLVAAYLCVGLIREKGYVGLLEGCACLEGMTDSFWPILYPDIKRVRARVNIMAWLSEKGADSIVSLSYGDRNLITDCLEKTALIEMSLSEKLGEPCLGALRRALEEQLQKTPATPVPAVPVAPVPQDVTVTALPRPAPLSSEADAEQIVGEAFDQIRKAASFVCEMNPASPWPYRVIRSLTWLKVDTLPSHNDNRETRIPPPAPHLFEHYQNLIQQEAWKEILVQAEAQMVESPFWLDLQYFSAQALSHFGASTLSAKQAVTDELMTLMKRVPKLSELTFADGTPFATEETRIWIEEVVAGDSLSPSDTVVPKFEEAAADDSINVMRKKITDLLRQGQIKEALALFQEEMAACHAIRKRFLLRLAFAKACIDSKTKETRLLKIAQSQLEMLDQEAIFLETWEPTLSLDFLEVFWYLMNALYKETKQPEMKERIEAIYQRISRRDLLCSYRLVEKQEIKPRGAGSVR